MHSLPRALIHSVQHVKGNAKHCESNQATVNPNSGEKWAQTGNMRIGCTSEKDDAGGHQVLGTRTGQDFVAPRTSSRIGLPGWLVQPELQDEVAAKLGLKYIEDRPEKFRPDCLYPEVQCC